MKNIKMKLIGLSLIVVTLSACGGGGGGGSAPATTTTASGGGNTSTGTSGNSQTTFQFKKAYTNYITAGFTSAISVKVTGSDSNGNPINCTGSGSYIINQPNQFDSFNTRTGYSVPAISSTSTLNISSFSSGSCSPYSSTVVSYFDPTTSNPLGDILNGQEYEVASGVGIPVFAYIGESGPLYLLTTYSDATETNYVSTTNENYSVTAGSDANTAIFTITSVTGLNTETTVFSLNTSAVLKPISDTLSTGGVNIVVTYQ